MIQTIFQRYELKYLLNPSQAETVQAVLAEHLAPDPYGQSTVQSLYLDTGNFQLARETNERPAFKEKIRLRCYGLNADDSKTVFLEMKRKVDGLVYKRRITCRETEVTSLLSGELPPTQIGQEIRYFLSFYGDLSPKILLLYERNAFFDPESDLRVTFDRRIRYRTDHLNFSSSLEGTPLLPEDTILMEAKAETAFPLWLCQLLSRESIPKVSFSKYGSAYLAAFREQHFPSEGGTPHV